MPKSVMPSAVKNGEVSKEKKRKNLTVLAKSGVHVPLEAHLLISRGTFRGITRLDCARERSKFRAPIFETEVFRKQLYYCMEESACDKHVNQSSKLFCRKSISHNTTHHQF